MLQRFSCIAFLFKPLCNNLLFSELVVCIHLESISNQEEIPFVCYYRCYLLTPFDGCFRILCNSKPLSLISPLCPLLGTHN